MSDEDQAWSELQRAYEIDARICAVVATVQSRIRAARQAPREPTADDDPVFTAGLRIGAQDAYFRAQEILLDVLGEESRRMDAVREAWHTAAGLVVPSTDSPDEDADGAP